MEVLRLPGGQGKIIDVFEACSTTVGLPALTNDAVVGDIAGPNKTHDDKVVASKKMRIPFGWSFNKTHLIQMGGYSGDS